MALSHEVFRMLTTIPSPRTRFTKLLVNGKMYGLYVEVERIGGKFLERHGRDRKSPMYESDPQEAASQGLGSLIPLPEKSMYLKGYDKKSGSDSYDDLITLIEDVIYQAHLKEDLGQLKQQINVPAYLDYLAVMTIIQNRDHFWKNFYFSLQKTSTGTKKWEFYPWDLDLSFGCIYTEARGTLCDIYVDNTPAMFGTRSPGTPVTYPTKGFFNLLTDVVLKDKEQYEKYRGRICLFLKSDAWNKRIPQLIKVYEAMLLPVIAEDDKDRIKDKAEFQKKVGELQTFVSKRKAFLSKELSCTQ